MWCRKSTEAAAAFRVEYLKAKRRVDGGAESRPPNHYYIAPVLGSGTGRSQLDALRSRAGSRVILALHQQNISFDGRALGDLPRVLFPVVIAVLATQRYSDEAYIGSGLLSTRETGRSEGRPN